MTLIEKIKLLFKVKQPLTDIVTQVKEVKKGYKTTGFWLTLIGGFLSLVGSFAGFIPANVALIITTVLTMFYNIIRALQNTNVPGVEPLFQSTRFWVGIMGIISNAIVALQQGGVNPEWFVMLNTILAAVMAGAQNLGAQQPIASGAVEPTSK